MTPGQLSRTVLHSLHGVLGDAGQRLDGGSLRVVVESPPRRGSGDYATAAAMGAARATGQDARPLAEQVGERLRGRHGIAAVTVSGAGFLNITLDADGRAALVRTLTGPDRSAPDAPAGDVARWAEASGESPNVLLSRTEASSLFRVQYAHARTRALLRNAAALRLAPEPGAGSYAYDVPAERRLLALLADERRLADAVRATSSGDTGPGRGNGRADGDPATGTGGADGTTATTATATTATATTATATTAPGGGAEAGRLARHLTDVADAFRDVHDMCPPLPRGEEKPGAVHRARLALTDATGAVLADGLSQLGVTAPAHL